MGRLKPTGHPKSYRYLLQLKIYVDISFVELKQFLKHMYHQKDIMMLLVVPVYYFLARKL